MFKRFLQKLLRRQIIKNYDKDITGSPSGRVLLYYKTDPFVIRSLIQDYVHTNYWEIVEMVRIFNKLGYVVDIIDRTIDFKKIQGIENKYDIFLGIGAGDSGHFYSDIAEKVPSAVKILYAMGPEPVLSNDLIKKRYDYFYERHPGLSLEMRRLITKVDVDKVMKQTDAIIINGNEFTANSYSLFNKDIYRVFSSSHPSLEADSNQLSNRYQNKFLYFGGNGNIVKGLDLVIEAFTGLPNLELYIGAPDYEKEFNKIFLPIIKESKNIHFLGFVKVGSPLFEDITSKCGYVILPSCSEGCATSVTTCMRRGLVPVVTYETGLDVDNFGYIIKDIKIDNFRKQIVEISNEPRDKFIKRSFDAYSESFQYTQDNFSKTFEQTILKIIYKNKKS